MRHTLSAVLLLLLTFTACADEPATTAADTQPAATPSSGQEPTATPATAPDTQPATRPSDDQGAEGFKPVQAYPPEKAHAEAWLDRIEAAANDVTSLTADLRYDRNQLLLGDEQRRFGTLVYQAGPPPKFQVHFNKKLVDDHWSQPDLYYIYDGRWLLKSDHENKTANRYQLVPDDEKAGAEMALGEGPFPIPLNLKKEKVLARFEAVVIPPADDDPANSVHLQLTPREEIETDLTTIDLWFDRDTLLPTAASTLDDSETQTIVRLTETITNPELPEQSFDTALPTEPGWQTDENRIQEEAE